MLAYQIVCAALFRNYSKRMLLLFTALPTVDSLINSKYVYNKIYVGNLSRSQGCEE